MKTYTNVITLCLTLKRAYVIACKALGLANKLGNKKHKGRILSRLNRIRSELKRYEDAPLFEMVCYNGVIVELLK
jgi:hypothetical protein